MKSSVKIELVDGEHLVSLIKRAFPRIKSIRDILKLDLLSTQSDQSINQRLPKSTKSNYRKIASKRDPLGLKQPNRPITVANRIDPGSSIIVDGYKVRVINQRQVQNLKLPKRDEKCPNCGMTLRGSLRYCVKDDWFFGNEKLPKSSIDKKLEYCKHHPNIELKGTDKYCFECDWEYS